MAKTAEEKRWQAESDAHTLAAAIRIQNDPVRYRAAKKVTSRLAKEAQAAADTLKEAGNQQNQDDNNNKRKLVAPRKKSTNLARKKKTT